jgi:hypothetical protein
MDSLNLEKITLATASGLEPPSSQPPTANSTSWWSSYATELEKKISKTALQVVDLDSSYILDKGVLNSQPRDRVFEGWPTGRLRRGLVMGAIQSGKTASLMAVTAKALDSGIQIVVVLGGTRTALWQQTYGRLLEQLDGWTNESDQLRRTRRLLLPTPQIMVDAAGTSELASLYFETPNLVRRMLSKKRPLIAVVMKQADHLERFRRYFIETLEPVLASTPEPIHLLVIDDEADDGSILDSEQERGLPYESDQLKQIPRHIARIWSNKSGGAETFHPKLFATYVAYTATPQANFLQSDHNPLSPTDFVASLRFPFDYGSVPAPRSATFSEPSGLSTYYTGGLAYYTRLNSPPGQLCRDTAFPEREPEEPVEDHEARLAQCREEILGEALRAYFVSGAVRLLQSGKSLEGTRQLNAATRDAVLATCPSPHTLLFHPSAKIETHFAGARDVALWSGCTEEEIDRGVLLNPHGLIARLNAEEHKWKAWLADFEASRQKLSFYPGGEKLPPINNDIWPELKRLMAEELFPNTRVRVINSDPRGDERPSFDPILSPNGYLPPEDIYTIFVSGNVMSRGITLEGLTTTVFLRSSDEPASDTQMQMQRWFGYRGAYLHLCRVFLFADQLALFDAYHQTDEALRSEVLGLMNEAPEVIPKPTVLQGASFRATSKISNLKALPLCPGANPFITPIEGSTHLRTNQLVLGELLNKNPWQAVTVGGTTRGRVMERRLSMLEVAQLLDRFRYTKHTPSAEDESHKRWRALERAHQLSALSGPLFRGPIRHGNGVDLVAPRNCPYSVAAYLRLWHALLSRPAVGIVPTDNPSTPWSLINLREYAASAPEFYVGVRFGSAGMSSVPEFQIHGIRKMKRDYADGILRATWGSRNPGDGPASYFGDQLFDYHVHSHVRPRAVDGEPLWRPRGAPGLVLFHVIENLDGSDFVTVGLGIPLGGPDHIAALRPNA